MVTRPAQCPVFWFDVHSPVTSSPEGRRVLRSAYLCVCLSARVSQNNNNNNNNNSHDNVYGAVIMTQSHCESSPGSSDECRLSAGWPPTLRPSQSTWAESAENWQLMPAIIHIHIHRRHCYYYPARKLILFLPSHEGWKAESI